VGKKIEIIANLDMQKSSLCREDFLFCKKLSYGVELNCIIIYKNNMATKKTGDANVRRLANRGRSSVGITFPMDLVKGLKWKAGKKVVVKVEKGRIVIEGLKK
jgi:hypothetical protein